MNNNKTKLFTLFFTIAVLVSVIYIEHNTIPSLNNKNSSSIYTKNITVPNFKYNTISNNVLNTKLNKFYDLKSDNTIIHFWATWCHSCRSEFSSLLQYASKNPQTTILAISIDDDLNHLKNFIIKLQTNNQNINIANLSNLIFSWDEDKSISMRTFGSYMVPENYVVNNQHKIIGSTMGKTNWDA